MPKEKHFQIQFGSPEAEKQLTKVSVPSSKPWEVVFRLLNLPDDLGGQRILDVGTGASDFVAELLDRGADAYAVDPAYKAPLMLKQKAVYHNQKSYQGEDLRRRNHVIEIFFKSFRGNRDRYISDSAAELKFPDNFFDLVTSIDTVTLYLDADPILLSKCVRELIRVVKPGKKFSFFLTWKE